LIKLSEDDSVAFIVKGLQAKDDAILHIGSFSKVNFILFKTFEIRMETAFPKNQMSYFQLMEKSDDHTLVTTRQDISSISLFEEWVSLTSPQVKVTTSQSALTSSTLV
jgi:hypothetical protein